MSFSHNNQKAEIFPDMVRLLANNIDLTVVPKKKDIKDINEELEKLLMPYFIEGVCNEISFALYLPSLSNKIDFKIDDNRITEIKINLTNTDVDSFANLIDDIQGLPSNAYTLNLETLQVSKKSIIDSLTNVFINAKNDPFCSLYNEFEEVIMEFEETKVEFEKCYNDYVKKLLKNEEIKKFVTLSNEARLKFKLLDIYFWCQNHEDKKKNFEPKLKEKLYAMGLVDMNGQINKDNHEAMKKDFQFSFALTQLYGFMYGEMKEKRITNDEFNNFFSKLQCQEEGISSKNLFAKLRSYLKDYIEKYDIDKKENLSEENKKTKLKKQLSAANELCYSQALKQNLLDLCSEMKNSNLRNAVVKFIKSPEPGLDLVNKYCIQIPKVNSKVIPFIFSQELKKDGVVEFDVALSNYIAGKTAEKLSSPRYNSFLTVFSPSDSAEIKISAAKMLIKNYHKVQKYHEEMAIYNQKYLEESEPYKESLTEYTKKLAIYKAQCEQGNPATHPGKKPEFNCSIEAPLFPALSVLSEKQIKAIMGGNLGKIMVRFINNKEINHNETHHGIFKNQIKIQNQLVAKTKTEEVLNHLLTVYDEMKNGPQAKR